LEEVEVETGEEEEEVLYSQRAKLFIFAETLLDVGTGNKTWKERGIGNIRIMRHRQHLRCRMLMRQEKTMKLIMNHLLLPGLVVVPHVTNDRALVWRAEDFCEGQIKVTDFCIRFADSEIAGTFKDTFSKYQEEMKKLDEGADAPVGEDGGAAVDEAAAAVAALSTKDEEETEVA
jgi:Ran-binding protein 1